MATACALSVHTVQRAEEGELTEATLVAVAVALGEPISRLRGGEGPPPPATQVLLYPESSAIDWLISAFGLEVRARIAAPDGRWVHGDLVLGQSRIAVGQPVVGAPWIEPGALEGQPSQTVQVRIDDVDAHHERARRAGAEILARPAAVEGQRCYQARDPAGHRWCFSQFRPTGAPAGRAEGPPHPRSTAG